MNYFVITKEFAESIGYLEYAPGKAIDLLVGKQKDGTYLINENTLTFIKENEVIISQYILESDKLQSLVSFDVNTTKIDQKKANEGLVIIDVQAQALEPKDFEAESEKKT